MKLAIQEVWKGLEMQATEGLEYCNQRLTNKSNQRFSDRNADSKDRLMRFQLGMRIPLRIKTTGHTLH